MNAHMFCQPHPLAAPTNRKQIYSKAYLKLNTYLKKVAEYKYYTENLYVILWQASQKTYQGSSNFPKMPLMSF